jgi:hypothetical protein
MSNMRYFLSPELVREISEVSINIEIQSCRQLPLLDAFKLSQVTHDNKTSNFNEKHIKQLWQLAFINADVVYSNQPIELEGIINLNVKDGIFYYADERILKEKSMGYSDSIHGLDELPTEINLLFHPFRCFVLYHINRIFALNIPPIQSIMSAQGFSRFVSGHLESFKSFTAMPETVQLFRYWNNVVSLCAISEPTAHAWIYNKVTWGYPDSYESMLKKLGELKKTVHSLFMKIGETAIESYRREICQSAEMLDPNKNLHLIIRLMDTYERNKLKGYIAGSMLFLTMAESLRRNLESAYEKQYPEEDEIGFGQVFPEAKLLLQGSTRVLDGDRLVANQFLRRFGLDYGIRVNIYAEGDTEFETLSAEFLSNSSVLVINLKGSFVEKGGKGVAFRKSLLNDIKSKTFSLILLDSDVTNNYRVVRKAAEDDEICGMFFISKPDFEFGNFTSKELAKIAFNLAREKGITQTSLEDIEKATNNSKSANEFFKALSNLSPDSSVLSKGKDWGRSLLKYALENPLSGDFGDKNDRLINQTIAVAYRCLSSSYEVIRQKDKVNPETGRLIPR